VISQPDRPRGRGGEISSSPVKEATLAAGVAVHQPEKIRAPEVQNFFRARSRLHRHHRLRPNYPGEIIANSETGWINLHASLLPKYRGAAPINWAIVNGERAPA